MIEHEIVIVGAGPTGLTLAAELKRLGVDSLIVDKQAEDANASRGAVIHARTLEVLEPLGVTADLPREGVIVPTFRTRDRDRILASISFERLRTAYPFTLMCPQNVTEAVLRRRLTELGVTIERPREVSSIRPSEDFVELEIKKGQQLRTARTNWLVGCDGMHSIVRESSAIPFDGGKYEESFAQMAWPFPRTEVDLFFSKKGLVVVAPLPGGIFRIVATENRALSGDISDFQQIIDERGPVRPRARIHRIVWSSRFHLQHRVSRTFRKGRVLIAGDAAHVHSPAGGQGMNTGFQDAVSLAKALRQAVADQMTDSLDVWQNRRFVVARNVVSMTDRITRAATLSSSAARFFRNALINVAGRSNFVRNKLAERLAELDIKEDRQIAGH
jgi:2-polyprenyl-6-methoxyphenol hydroxylase-like FAD-dependent oxidoreductase